MTGKDAFAALKHEIEQAVSLKEWSRVEASAVARGLSKTDISTIYALAYDYELQCEDERRVRLEFVSRDTSRAFQVLPDIYKFELTLIDGETVVDRYANSYLD